jgi:hypothetical protein
MTWRQIWRIPLGISSLISDQIKHFHGATQHEKMHEVNPYLDVELLKTFLLIEFVAIDSKWTFVGNVKNTFYVCMD